MNNQSELEKYVKELEARVTTLEAKVEMLDKVLDMMGRSVSKLEVDNMVYGGNEIHTMRRY